MNPDDPHVPRVIPANPLRFPRFDPASLLRPPADALDDDIDVWPVALDATEDDVTMWVRSLSLVERHRSERFFRASDRVAYIVAHGVMRHVLALYCGVEPGALAFGSASNSKPRLEGVSDRNDVRFNLAHSGGCALLAVTRGQEVGVDLEVEREGVGALALAGRYFFGSERDAITAAPRAAQTATFFRYWVAKESVLKAEGVGLRFPLDGFSVDFGNGGETATVRSSDSAALSDAWRVRMLPAPSGWQAALAAKRARRVVVRYA